MKYKRDPQIIAMILLLIWIGALIALCASLVKEHNNNKKLPYTVQVIDITNSRTTTYVGNPRVKSNTLYIYDARELWSTSHENMVE